MAKTKKAKVDSKDKTWVRNLIYTSMEEVMEQNQEYRKWIIARICRLKKMAALEKQLMELKIKDNEELVASIVQNQKKSATPKKKATK